MTSYQSGGVPTWETAIGGGSGADEEVESQMQNQWETRYGMRVDFLAAWAYVLGPISGAPHIPRFLQSSFDLTESPNLAFCMLIMETHNDFVRFHGVPALHCPLVLFSLILYSVPVCVTDYSSHTFEDFCVTPAATFRLVPLS